MKASPPNRSAPGTPVWAVAGSSCRAKEALAAAYSHRHVNVSITCNAGAHLFDGKGVPVEPTFYYLSDVEACRLFCDKAKELQHRYGTMLLVPRRRPRILRALGISNADQMIVQDMAHPVGEHTPGAYSVVPLSGLAIADIALKRGARTLLLCGFDGYEHDPTAASYFDGRTGGANPLTKNGYQARYFRTAIEREPGVRFVFFGRPAWGLPEGAPNLTVLTHDGQEEQHGAGQPLPRSTRTP
jgi:hypothetical protein